MDKLRLALLAPWQDSRPSKQDTTKPRQGDNNPQHTVGI